MTVSPLHSTAVRAGVVARHLLVRDGLADLLRAASIEVVASVGSFADLDEADSTVVADVAVVVMPDDSGIGVVVAGAGGRWTDPTRLEQPVVVIDWDARTDDLIRLIRSPSAYPCPLPRDNAASGSEPPTVTRLGLSDLTDREINMLALLAGGKSATEAAHALGISPHTARTHIANLMRKLQVHSRLEAVSATRELLAAELARRDVAV